MKLILNGVNLLIIKYRYVHIALVLVLFFMHMLEVRESFVTYCIYFAVSFLLGYGMAKTLFLANRDFTPPFYGSIFILSIAYFTCVSNLIYELIKFENLDGDMIVLASGCLIALLNVLTKKEI